jgi:hypothetical protein
MCRKEFVVTTKTIVKAVDAFFFKPQPVNSVAMMRILFGVILMIHWFSLWSHLEVFWGPEGLLSLAHSIERTGEYRINLFSYFPADPRVGQLLALAHLLAAFGMVFGFFTRTSIAIAFFTLVSFHNRNYLILNSSDVILRNLVFFLFFTPCGELYSVDNWIRRARGLAHAPVERAPWALRLVQLQFCTVYVATVLYKLKGGSWADGTAIYIATRLDEFVRVPLALLNSMFVIKFLTWSTLLVEFSLGTLVWLRDLRYWILLAGVGLHIGIEITMNIPLFEWIMIAGMAAMIESHDIVRVTAWLEEKSRSLIPTFRATGVSLEKIQ